MGLPFGVHSIVRDRREPALDAEQGCARILDGETLVGWRGTDETRRRIEDRPSMI